MYLREKGGEKQFFFFMRAVAVSVGLASLNFPVVPTTTCTGAWVFFCQMDLESSRVHDEIFLSVWVFVMHF